MILLGAGKMICDDYQSQICQKCSYYPGVIEPTNTYILIRNIMYSNNPSTTGCLELLIFYDKVKTILATHASK